MRPLAVRQVREGEAKEVPSNAAGGGNEKEGKGLRDAAASGDQKGRRKGWGGRC